MLIFLFLLWFVFGYILWRAVYYGAIKFWYLEYGQDYRSSYASKHWRKVMPIIVAAGWFNSITIPLSGLAGGMAFKYGFCLYFKIPEGTPKCIYTQEPKEDENQL